MTQDIAASPQNGPEKFSWKDRPALIEHLFPAQQISIEAYKEQMANIGKTLTGLGSYWKGRKPLVLNRAVILASLLPAHDPAVDKEKAAQDLIVFQILMGMGEMGLHLRTKDLAARDVFRIVQEESLRGQLQPIPPHLAALVSADIINGLYQDPDSFFDITGPDKKLSTLKDFNKDSGSGYKVAWKKGLAPKEKQTAEFWARAAINNRNGSRAGTYHDKVRNAERAENVDHMTPESWAIVNAHLGTNAQTLPDLVEQMGIARFGRRPKMADTFSGSGQIPFEAARIGCDAYASDLNPVACMLTWGAFSIVGADAQNAERIKRETEATLLAVRAELDATPLGEFEDSAAGERVGLQVETQTDPVSGMSMRAQAFLYCVEIRCPITGAMVPALPSLIVSKPKRLVVDLKFVPNLAIDGPGRYDITLRQVSADELTKVDRMATMQKGTLIHRPAGESGKEYRSSVADIRKDRKDSEGNSINSLRKWALEDVAPAADDIYQERLYAVLWEIETGKLDKKGEPTTQAEFRAASNIDHAREIAIRDYVEGKRASWQAQGWIPDMAIEAGDKTDEPIRTRGWTHWHHLFNPRQLLLNGLFNKHATVEGKVAFAQVLSRSCKLCPWNNFWHNTELAFYNQSLNTLWINGCRGYSSLKDLFLSSCKPRNAEIKSNFYISNETALKSKGGADIYVTDPPYGDAVKYEEIYEFFIAWLRKNPIAPMDQWTWDSRRALAIKGEDERFRQGMIEAYKAMANNMSDNGLQVLMFTHQSNSIWADMANIVWAAGLQVSAAWYVATETDSALRQGAYVKGTVLLVLRKRTTDANTFRDDLAYAIADAVRDQVESLKGLNSTQGSAGQEALFNDADLQMAAYAAALRVLTSHRFIDGKDMTLEAARPRTKGHTTLVDDMVGFAVEVANAHLVPVGIAPTEWSKLSSIERFFLKMTEHETRGEHKLDGYQNFAKAYKVRDFSAVMAKTKANKTALLTPKELEKKEMGETSELGGTLVRGVLYAIYQIGKGMDGDLAVDQLEQVVSSWSQNPFEHRQRAATLADWLASQWENQGRSDASDATVLRDLIRHQKL